MIHQPKRGLRDLGGEFFNLNPVKLVNITQDVDLRHVKGSYLRFTVQLPDDVHFQEPQFPVGNDKEVSASASRIKEFELGKALMKLIEFLWLAFHPLEFRPQLVQKQGADEFQDVLFRCVVRS